MSDQYFTVSVTEMMKSCDISRRTVYDWVSKGIVRAYKVKSSIMLHREDVKNLSSFVSVRSASKILDLPYPYLLNKVRELDVLVTPTIPHLQGKYYVMREWLEQQGDVIKEKYLGVNKRIQKKVLGRRMELYRNQLRLFDSIDYQGQSMRVLSVGDPIKFLTMSGSTICIDDVILGNSRECLNVPYISHGGSVLFRFKFKNLQNDMSALDDLVYFLGEKNIYVYEDKDCYNIVCRHSLIPYNDNIYLILSRRVVEGIVWVDGKGSIVIGDLEYRFNFPIKYKKMLAIEERLKKEQKTLIEWIADQVSEFENDI